MFAYCNNNPCNYGDPSGYVIEGIGKQGRNAMNYKSGSYVQWWEPGTLFKQEKTFVYKMITDPVGTVHEICCSVYENVHDTIEEYEDAIIRTIGSGRIGFGLYKIKAGFIILATPIPGPVDDAIAAWKICSGFSNVIKGIGNLFIISEEDK